MESKFNPKLKSAPCSSSLRCIRATCTGKEALLRRCRQTRKPLDLTFCSTRGRNAALWPVHPVPGACSGIGRYWTLAADWSDWSASPGLPYHLCRAALSRSCRGDEQAPPQKLQILCHPLLRDVPLRFGCLQRWRSRVKVTPPSIDRHRTSLTRQWPSGSRHNDRRQAKAYACIHHSARLLLRPPPSAATAANNGSGTKRPAPPAPDNAFRPCPGHFSWKRNVACALFAGPSMPEYSAPPPAPNHATTPRPVPCTNNLDHSAPVIAPSRIQQGACAPAPARPTPATTACARIVARNWFNAHTQASDRAKGRTYLAPTLPLPSIPSSQRALQRSMKICCWLE